MTLSYQHQRGICAAVALLCFFLGAWAIRARKAELPLHIFSLTVAREKQPFAYWFCVTLYFMVGVGFLYSAWFGVI
jgi:hypothetical protein